MSVNTNAAAIDLSGLPAPIVVEQLSHETIFQEMVDALNAPDMLSTFDQVRVEAEIGNGDDDWK